MPNPTQTTEAPERIELLNGCYWQSAYGMRDDYGRIYKADGKVAIQTISRDVARSLAAVMQPVTECNALREALRKVRARINQICEIPTLDGEEPANKMALIAYDATRIIDLALTSPSPLVSDVKLIRSFDDTVTERMMRDLEFCKAWQEEFTEIVAENEELRKALATPAQQAPVDAEGSLLREYYVAHRALIEVEVGSGRVAECTMRYRAVRDELAKREGR